MTGKLPGPGHDPILPLNAPGYTESDTSEGRDQVTKCPVCGMMVDEATAPSSDFGGKTYYFHIAVHKEMFDKDPEKFLGDPSDQGDHMSGGMKMDMG